MEPDKSQMLRTGIIFVHMPCYPIIKPANIKFVRGGIMKLDDYIEYMIVTGDDGSSSNKRDTPPTGQVGCLSSVIISLAVIALLAVLL